MSTGTPTGACRRPKRTESAEPPCAAALAPCALIHDRSWENCIREYPQISPCSCCLSRPRRRCPPVHLVCAPAEVARLLLPAPSQPAQPGSKQSPRSLHTPSAPLPGPDAQATTQTGQPAKECTQDKRLCAVRLAVCSLELDYEPAEGLEIKCTAFVGAMRSEKPACPRALPRSDVHREATGARSCRWGANKRFSRFTAAAVRATPSHNKLLACTSELLLGWHLHAAGLFPAGSDAGRQAA